MDASFFLRCFSNLLKIKLGAKIPLYVQWEITERCNLNCIFCTASNANKWQPELGFEDVIKRIDQFAKLGTMSIHLSGGEPSLYPRIDEVIRYAKSKGIHTGVTTNGTTPPEKQELLLGADMHRISLDGLKERHDSLRGKGSFEKVMETVNLLKTHHRTPVVTAMMDADTTEEYIDSFISFCNDNDILVNLHKISFTSHQITGEDNYTPNDFQRKHMLDNDRFIAIVKRMREKWKGRIIYPKPYLTIMAKGGLKKFGCRVFDVAIGLKPDGSISIPCNEYPVKTLKVMPFEFYKQKMHEPYLKAIGRYPFCDFCNCRCMGTASALTKIRTLIETAISSLSYGLVIK